MPPEHKQNHPAGKIEPHEMRKDPISLYTGLKSLRENGINMYEGSVRSRTISNDSWVGSEEYRKGEE
jgi:hypothetical protein